MKVYFTPGQLLMVPDHPPLPYEIRNQQPPRDDHIRRILRGDQSFSNTQYVQICLSPAYFIARKTDDAEWLIVNKAEVIMVSSKK